MRSFPTAFLICLGLVGNAQADARRHDGLQVRVGLGGAYGLTTATAGDGPDVDTSGVAVGAMVLVGWTVTETLTVGAAPLMGFHVFSPTVEIDGNEVSGADPDPVAGNIAGVYVDWYLDPAGGLHVLGQLGLATLQDSDSDTDLALGFGGTLGVGYDMFVTDEWSIGGLLRFQFLSTSVDTDVAGRTITTDHTTMVPALLFTGAWH